jgi:hypothetical protein
LAKVKKDIGVLETFYNLNDVNNQWSDIARRNIGHVHWALKISVDFQGRSYTKDIGTFEVDAVRFKLSRPSSRATLSIFDSSFSYFPRLTKRTLFRIQVYSSATH